MKKSNKNQKITKEDLKKFDTKRVIKDLNKLIPYKKLLPKDNLDSKK